LQPCCSATSIRAGADVALHADRAHWRLVHEDPRELGAHHRHRLGVVGRVHGQHFGGRRVACVEVLAQFAQAPPQILAAVRRHDDDRRARLPRCLGSRRLHRPSYRHFLPAG
jgi:hypothetical protein